MACGGDQPSARRSNETPMASVEVARVDKMRIRGIGLLRVGPLASADVPMREADAMVGGQVPANREGRAPVGGGRRRGVRDGGAPCASAADGQRAARVGWGGVGGVQGIGHAESRWSSIGGHLRAFADDKRRGRP